MNFVSFFSYFVAFSKTYQTIRKIKVLTDHRFVLSAQQSFLKLANLSNNPMNAIQKFLF